MSFEGRVALVTGAASGNGRAIALRLAQRGAAVVCADRTEQPLAEGWDGAVSTNAAIAADGGRAVFARCDVTSGEDVSAAVRLAVDTYGRLDVVVANAGVSLKAYDLPDESWDDYEQTVAVNQHGVWWTCREASRQMVAQGEGGRIVLLASVAGLVGFPAGIAYNATKGAVVQMARTLAAQLGPHGITANAICPGYIKTAMTRGIWDDEERLERVRLATPLRRLGDPEDVAAAAVFLASDDARFITGVMLPVDGGWTAV
jgi:NAD(P)-dependent dehydrogenase (short-subunit alcohol dehydrogenase family)